VTDIPGTTRDLLKADIEIQGIPIRLTDTAGLREGGDRVETIGVERARSAMAAADLVLTVEDASVAAIGGGSESGGLASKFDPSTGRSLRVRNKIDLTDEPPGDGGDMVRISALSGAGVDALRAAIAKVAGVAPGEGAYLARRRHLDALTAALGHCRAATRRVDEGCGDLAAEELRSLQARLGEIVGLTTVDDLLGEIFGSFCIGK